MAGRAAGSASAAPPRDGSLELALVHLRATLDPEALCLPVQLLLGATCRHGDPLSLLPSLTCLPRWRTPKPLRKTSRIRTRGAPRDAAVSGRYDSALRFVGPRLFELL